MAIATNTTEGQILLLGDLSGTGDSPQLRETGVTASTYALPKVIIDAKGRIIYSKNLSQAEFERDLLPVIPIATTSILGRVQISDGFSITSGGLLSANIPSSSVLGTVRISSPFTIDGSGILSFDPASIIATTSTQGTIRPGSDMSTTSEGILNLTPRIINSSGFAGVFSIDGSTIQIASGAISARTASTTQTGIITVGGNNLSIDGSGILSFDPGGSNIATTSKLGTIRPGSDMSTTSEGILNLTPRIINSSGLAGLFSIDGSTIQITSGAISARTASTTQTGVITVGTNFSSTSGTLSANIASNANQGTIILGTPFLLNTDIISVPDATTSSKGIFRTSIGLSVTNGVLSLANATTASLGGVIIDNASLSNGLTYSSPILGLSLASTSTPGTIIPGTGFQVNGEILTPRFASASELGVIRTDDGPSGSLQHFDVSSGTLSTPIVSAPFETRRKIIGGISSDLNLTGHSMSIPAASATLRGVFKIDPNFFSSLQAESGFLRFNGPTTSGYGAPRIGSGLSIDGNGILSAVDGSTTAKGIVQPGTGLNFSSGIISVPISSASTLGTIRIGNGIDIDGITSHISYATAKNTSLGLAQIGSNISVSSGVISVPIATAAINGIARPIGSHFSITSGITSANVVKPTGTTFTATQSNAVTDFGSVSGTVNIASTTSPFITMTATGNITLVCRDGSNNFFPLPRSSYYIFIKSTGNFTISGQYTDFNTWPPLSQAITSSQICIIKIVSIPASPGLAVNEVKIVSA